MKTIKYLGDDFLNGLSYVLKEVSANSTLKGQLKEANVSDHIAHQLTEDSLNGIKNLKVIKTRLKSYVPANRISMSRLAQHLI